MLSNFYEIYPSAKTRHWNMLMTSALRFWKIESYITLNIILKNTWNGNTDKDIKIPHQM